MSVFITLSSSALACSSVRLIAAVYERAAELASYLHPGLGDMTI